MMQLGQSGIDFVHIRYLINKLPKIDWDIIKERSKAEKMTTVVTGMPHGSGGDHSPVEDGAIKITELKEAYDEVLDELDRIGEKLSPMIARIDKINIRAAMMLRYIKRYSANQIANAINYSDAQVYRLLKRGEAEIEKMIANDSEC